MTKNHEIVNKMIGRAFSGEGAHAGSRGIFEGLGWKVAGTRPAGAPHSLFQLLHHLIYWQDWVVKWLDGKTPPIPKHASGCWLKDPSPASREEWERAVRDFCKGLEALEQRSRAADLLAKRGKKSRLEMLQGLASHNSYHLGQAALLRQMVGAWPPPSGGLTW